MQFCVIRQAQTLPRLRMFYKHNILYQIAKNKHCLALECWNSVSVRKNNIAWPQNVFFLIELHGIMYQASILSIVWPQNVFFSN